MRSGIGYLLAFQLACACASNALADILIDSNWLAQHGPAPYLLEQSGATYKLMTDVTVPESAFVVAAPDITFNLNRHRIVYDNTPPIRIVNGGFERKMAGGLIPGWKLQGTQIQQVPAPAGMWGKSALKFSGNSTQIITSDPIKIPAASREYAALVTPKGPSQRTVEISVKDLVTGVILASEISPSTERGFAAVAVFSPTTTHDVAIIINVTPPAGQSADILLDYVSLVRSRNYGIMATQIWEGNGGLPIQLQNLPDSYRDSANFKLLNGTVIQGTGRSRAGSPGLFYENPKITMNKARLTASGVDTAVFDGKWATDVTVTSSRLGNTADRVSNRMAINAALDLNQLYGTALISSNTISGVPHVGILVGGMEEQKAVTIINNSITQNSRVTDGYGIIFAGVRNFDVGGNMIVPINGRGFLVDDWGRITTEDGYVHDNYFYAYERPALEYGSQFEPTGLRVRNLESAYRNITFNNNVAWAETDANGAWAAIGARITLRNFENSMNNAGLILTNNTFHGAAKTSNQSFWAAGLSFSVVESGINPQFHNNKCESNVSALQFADNDGWEEEVKDFTMTDTILNKLTNEPAHTFASILAGGWEEEVSGISVLNTAVQNGAPKSVKYGGPADITVTWK